METRRGKRHGPTPGRLGAACVAAFVLAGCATRVTVTRMRPAELELAGLDHVALMELGGNDGGAFASELTRRLFDAKLDVLDPRGLATLPASALILGDAQTAASDATGRKVTECPGVQDSKDRVCFEYSRTVGLSYVANLTVVDSRTGAVLAPRSLTCSASGSTSAVDAAPELVDVFALAATCRQDVVSRFLPLVAPTAATEEVVLVEDDALPPLAAGNRFAKRGDWAAAGGEYAKAAARAEADASLTPKARAKAHYALGLSLVLAGRFDEGLVALGKAVALADRDEARDLLRRAREWQADAEKLRRQRAGSREARRG